MSTSRSSVYDASLAAPLMSASAWATARIARAMPGSDQPGTGRARCDLPRRHPEVAGQVGLAHAAGRRRGSAPARAALPANAEVTSTGAVPPSSAQRSSSSATCAAPGEGGVGHGERLRLGPAAEVLLDLSTSSCSSGEVAGQLVAAADSERRSWPTACTRKPRRPGRSWPPGRATSAATKPGNSDGLELGRLHLGDGGQLAQLGEHARCPSARRRGPAPGRRRRPARRRSRAARRRTRRAGPRGPGHHAAGGREQRGRRHLAQGGEGEVGGRGLRELGLGVVGPDRVAHLADRALAEELLLAGHQGDPAEDVGCAGCDLPQRPADPSRRSTRHAESPSPSTVTSDVAVEVGAEHLAPRSRERRRAPRRPGGRSRCRRPTETRATRAPSAGQPVEVLVARCRGAAP